MKFKDEQTDWCTASDLLHLLKSYDAEFGLDLQELESVQRISIKAAKATTVRNTEFDEDNPDSMPERFSLYDLGGTDHNSFLLLASTNY